MRTTQFRLRELNLCATGEEDVIALRALLHGPSLHWRVEAEALDREQVVAQAAVEVAAAVAELRLEIPGAKRWSPESPQLYDVRVRLFRGGRLQDEVSSYTGLRCLRLEGNRLLLNASRPNGIW